MELVCVLVKVLQRTRTNKMYIYIYIYLSIYLYAHTHRDFEELYHAIVEARQVQNILGDVGK